MTPVVCLQSSSFASKHLSLWRIYFEHPIKKYSLQHLGIVDIVGIDRCVRSGQTLLIIIHLICHRLMSKPTMSTSQSSTPSSTPPEIQHHQQSRLGMLYDIGIMILIVINLLMLAIDAILLSRVGLSMAEFLGQGGLLMRYRVSIHPIFEGVDDWITVFLIVELAARWLWAISRQHYHRWFFFPFVHWYEVLGCLPTFRALRLLRAVVLGYRLHKMGYTVLPQSWIKLGHFYYQLVLEEISDRIILNVIDGIENELRKSTTHGELIRDLVERHRPQLVAATGEILQAGLAPVLAERTDFLREQVGQAVHRALADIPELHQLLRLIPVVGSRIELQVQSIGKRIGDNLTAELIKPFSDDAARGQTANPMLQAIAEHVGEIPLQTEAVEALVESLVFESLATIRQQVAVQQWKIQAAADDALPLHDIPPSQPH